MTGQAQQEMDYQVTVCETAPQTVLRVPLEIRTGILTEGILSGMNLVSEVARRAGLTASGAPTITFHRELPADRAITVDFGLPVEPAPGLGPTSGADLVIQPATLVARTCHRGGYQFLDAAYKALREWLHEAGYRPIGPPTEAYLIGPDEVSTPRQLITEIRIPVAPSPAIAVHLDATFPAAVAETREALRQNGFGVLTEIDVQAVLRERVGEHIEEYVILGACNPRLAAAALAADRQAGLLLPCNVVVRTDETGVLVEAADPEVLLRTTGQAALEPVAARARRLLDAALDSLRKGIAPTT
ncbi:DUF302 domain-containing protein [Nocardia crassostreae]|uniref:DUF302 domain-containing protein n=1 Tax=Nocardia crassostreae TaxID=53428 RepID=UPI000AB72783